MLINKWTDSKAFAACKKYNEEEGGAHLVMERDGIVFVTMHLLLLISFRTLKANLNMFSLKASD